MIRRSIGTMGPRRGMSQELQEESNQAGRVWEKAQVCRAVVLSHSLLMPSSTSPDLLVKKQVFLEKGTESTIFQ